MINAILGIFVVLLWCYMGGGIYRHRGSAHSLPRPLDQAMFCMIFVFGMYIKYIPWQACLAAYVPSVALCCTGHGQYFMAMLAKAMKAERTDFIIWPFFGRDPRVQFYTDDESQRPPENDPKIIAAITAYGIKKLYWRCIAGMSVTGLAVSIFPGIATAIYVDPALGICMGLSGLLKGPVYAISWKLGYANEGGEKGWGFVQWASVVALCLVLA